MHDTLVIDGIYSSFKATPCHFCHRELWFNQRLSKEKIAESSWFAFYKRAIDESWPIVVSLPLSELERSAALCVLKRNIEPFLGGVSSPPSLEDLICATRYRIPSGNISKDLVPHSEFCDCLLRKAR